MENKPLKFISITFLVILIPLLNFLLFLVYYFAYPDLGVWTKMWNYLSSAVFTLVTGSLIIPLLFAILEKRYKFIENIQKQREDKRKLLEEQKRQGRQETINSTIQMWQKLYDLTSEVIFFIPDEKDQGKINNLIIQLHSFTSSAEHIVNKWGHQFPNLDYKDHDVFLEYINILYQSGLSISYYIRNGVEKKERESLQDMLLMIQDLIKSIANHRIINVLKYSARILEFEEAGETGAELNKLKQLLEEDMAALKDWSTALSDLDDQYDNFLAPAEGPQIEEVRVTARKIEKWLKEDQLRNVNQSEHFAEFQIKYNAINLEERLSTAGTPYSKEYIKALADWLSLEAACIYVYNRAHNIW